MSKKWTGQVVIRKSGEDDLKLEFRPLHYPQKRGDAHAAQNKYGPLSKMRDMRGQLSRGCHLLHPDDGVVEIRYPDECWHCGSCRQDCPAGAIKIVFPPIMANV